MDLKKSPDLSPSPDAHNFPNVVHNIHNDDDNNSTDSNMAALVANSHVPNLPSSQAGINKRYRPTPAKTFQCRGYGECRMVFSRSEHLARHIRKHTGERPFTCHCGKQFSRLDNLRQHAQTVHADKQDQNERMMRELTSLHASMAAANKVGNGRGSRRGAGGPSAGSLGNHSSAAHGIDGGAMGGLVKQEDVTLSMHHSQRPGTSTGYEGDHPGLIYQPPAWHVQANPDAHSRPNSTNHSFRDPGQSFLASQSSLNINSNNATNSSAQSQSFLPFASSFSFSVPDSNQQLQHRDAGRPRSSASRPTTAGGTSLPPLSSVFSSTIPASPSQSPFSPPSATQQQSFSQQQQSSATHVLPFPLRPSTATRPGTAPASASSSLVANTPSSAAYYGRSTFFGGSGGLVGGGSRPPRELSIFPHGRGNGGELGPPSSSAGYDADPASPTSGGPGDSPFFYSPPAITEHQYQQQQQPGRAAAAISGYNAAPATTTTSRKRTYTGPDGPNDEHSIAASSASHGPSAASSTASYNGEYYEYGSESRPQSRRLSVMELCNEPSQSTGLGAFLLSTSSASAASSGIPSGYGGLSRPNTSSGLVSSASALALVDRPSPPLLARAAQAAAAAASASAAGAYVGGGAGAEEFGGGGGLSPAARRGLSTTPVGGAAAASARSSPAAYAASPSPPYSYASTTPTTTASHILSYRGGSSPASTPPSGRFPDSPTFSAGPYSPRSPAAASAHVRSVSRRPGAADGGDDQVRIAVSPSHSPAIVGMRV